MNEEVPENMLKLNKRKANEDPTLIHFLPIRQKKETWDFSAASLSDKVEGNSTDTSGCAIWSTCGIIPPNRTRTCSLPKQCYLEPIPKTYLYENIRCGTLYKTTRSHLQEVRGVQRGLFRLIETWQPNVMWDIENHRLLWFGKCLMKKYIFKL